MKIAKKIKLQNIVFYANQQLEEYSKMMYRGSRYTYDCENSCFCYEPGDFAEFFTYFNVFALKKWRKYTNIGNVYLQLRCRGRLKIRLFSHYREGGQICKEMYEEHYFELPEMTDIRLPVPEYSRGDVVGFQFEVPASKNPNKKSVEKTCIECGGWYTDVPDDALNEVNISIATTTFRKEDYIRRNIDILERELFYSGEPARDHFRLIITDNGSTLDPEEFDSEFITVHPNSNVGGAGGFTRGMIESLDVKDFKATHVLLMDDDVTVMPEAFLRTYTLLSLVKEEYRERFVSGAMLYYERMNIQHEDVGYVHEDGSYGPNKRIMDMELWDSVFENDEDVEFRKNSYAGWWYCCIPVSKIRADHLPVPLFIRGDDVEFSLANKAEFLTLNGICIWHKGFANKFNANLELYMVHRNSLIIQAMSGICRGIDFIGRIDGFFRSNMCRLAYNNCELLLDAIEEFSAGPDFMLKPDGENIMKSHAAKNEKMKAAKLVWDEDIDFDSVYRYEDTPLSEREKWVYLNTYNGHTLPEDQLEKGKTAVIAYDWFDDPAKQFMAEQILAVNPFDHTVCLRKRDNKRFRQLVARYERVMGYYEKNKNAIEKKYREAAKTLQSEEFWREYLGMK